MESRKDVLETLSGWDTVQLIFKCIFVGLWQIIQISVKKLWKGHRRKLPEDCVPVELTVDSSIGTHCHIKIMGVKYHYVETGPKLGQIVLILKDAPDAGNLWGPNWSNFVQKLAETDHHIITLDLRGTGGSEGGSRSELAPPKAVEELSKLLESLGVSESRRAVVIGFGIGGMLAWYLVHCSGSLVSKFAVIGAPHPNLYWQHPPAAFCRNVLYFIQWPYFPERWLAENEGRCNTTRACDWMGALNYVRGAAWWRIKAGVRTVPPALLVGSKDNANELVDSARHCVNSTLRLVVKPDPSDRELPPILLEFLIV